MSNLAILLCIFALYFAPTVAGVIIAKKKNRSPHWFWLSLIPCAGFWVFAVMLFLPPLAICESCKQKIPADAKICPFCETKTPLYERTTEEVQKAKKKRRKTILLSALALVAIVFVMCFALINSVFLSLKTCEPYKHSIELLESNEEVMEYLGENYSKKGVISGSLKSNTNGTGSAEITYKVRGKNGDSVVYVSAEKENGVWVYKKVLFYKKRNSSATIDLLSGSDSMHLELSDGVESIASAKRALLKL